MRYLCISLITIGLILLLSGLPAKQPARECYKSAALSDHDTLLPSYLNCKDCHGKDPEGVASTTKEGKDINVMDDWSVSMKAFSSRDPLWRAQMEYELIDHDSSDLDACLRCHAPAAYHKSLFQGKSFSLKDLHNDSLALEGVQCASCHQMSTFDDINGLHSYAVDGTIKGPYPQPFSGPMEDLFGWPVKYDAVMRSSEACKSCHTVFHENASGDIIAEQATYFEWSNSAYQFQQKECQFCHMPYVFDSIKLATEYPFLDGRTPFARHQFLGANHWMLTALRDQFDDAKAIPDEIWTERLEQHKAFLRGGASIRIAGIDPLPDDHLISEIEIINLSGHKFPTGYPSRKALVEVIVIDQIKGDTLFHSGGPMKFYTSDTYSPHFEQIRSEDQVQVYEFQTLDISKQINYSLLSADTVPKDNRIPPLGFTQSENDTFGVKGFALSDPDYSNGEGMDRLEYLIATEGRHSIVVQANLYYLQVKRNWMQALTGTDFPLADSLLAYSRQKPPLSLIASDTSYFEVSHSRTPESLTKLTIYPNPVSPGQWVTFKGQDAVRASSLISMDGRTIFLPVFQGRVAIPDDLPPGIYLFVLDDGRKGRIVVR